MKYHMYYILEGHDVKPCDLMTWARWLESANRKIDYTETKNGNVSTVCLGLNHQFDDGPPLLFETMVFRGTEDGDMERYSTYDQAIRGHKKMVDKIEKGHE